MYSLRSNISSILLFLFVVIQVLPLAFNICIQLNYHTKSFETEKLVSLQFSQQEWAMFHYIKKNEVDIHGKMFDIKSLQIIGTQVQVSGYFDSKEDDLMTLEKEIKQKGMNIEKQSSFFYALFFEEIPSINFCHTRLEPTKHAGISQAFYSCYISADVPPPKIC